MSGMIVFLWLGCASCLSVINRNNVWATRAGDVLGMYGIYYVLIISVLGMLENFAQFLVVSKRLLYRLPATCRFAHMPCSTVVVAQQLWHRHAIAGATQETSRLRCALSPQTVVRARPKNGNRRHLLPLNALLLYIVAHHYHTTSKWVLSVPNNQERCLRELGNPYWTGVRELVVQRAA